MSIPRRASAPLRRTAVTRSAVVALLLATLLGGCALALSRRAPPRYSPEEHGAPACTSSPGRAVADATAAATIVQLGVWWLLSWESQLLPAPPPEILIPAFALGGGHAASAVYGYNESLRCKQARWLYELSRADGEEAGLAPDEELGR